MAPAWLNLHEGGHETAAPRQPSGGSRRGAPVAIRADRLLEGERHRLAPDARIWRIRGLLDRASRALPSCWRGHPLTAPAWLPMSGTSSLRARVVAGRRCSVKQIDLMWTVFEAVAEDVDHTAFGHFALEPSEEFLPRRTIH